MSCTSVTSERSFSTDSRASNDWPLTTIRTSYSLDGKSRETCSNCLNAGSSDRNNWLSEFVDPDSLDSQNGQHGDRERDQNRRRRSPERNEREPLEAERDAEPTPAGSGGPINEVPHVQSLPSERDAKGRLLRKERHRVRAPSCC